MRKHKLVLFTFLLLIFAQCQHLLAQVVASTTIGCAPLPVNFSAAPGASSASWNFGAAGTSSQLNPQIVFSAPGIYNVTYSGVGGNPTSAAIQITVVQNNINPSFSFTTPQSGCAPMPVNFVAAPAGANYVYAWAFGDGGQGTTGSMTHAYTLGGIFNPTLTVTDQTTGCKNTVTNGPINVSTLPNLVITANPGLASCQAPFTTSFNASSSTSGSPFGGALTYTWNFGNSQTSNTVNPGAVTYNNQGVYTVTLTGTDNNNCTNSVTAVVSVVQPTVALTVSSPSICIFGQEPPLASNYFLVSVQSSQPNVNITMGDGNTLTMFLPSPSAIGTHTYTDYSTPGTKTLVATVSIGNCVATATKTIFVEQVIPQFIATPPSLTCSPTFTTSYINQSTVNSPSPLSYSWNVQHWNHQPAYAYTSTVTNPSFTLTQGSTNPYAWYGAYAPVITLTAQTSPLGCYSITTHVYDTIWRPTAWFNKTKKQGCLPLSVQFRDSSDTSPLYPIQTYSWNNGANPPTIIAGTVPPTPIQNPMFTYTATGTYTPYLVITTAGGCRDTSFIDTVIVVNQPTVSLAFPFTDVCAGQPVTINMSAAPSSSVIQHWHVQTDDNFFSGCVSNPNPTWPFNNIGVHGFTVSAYDHGCVSRSATSQTVMVKGPLAKGRYQTNCTNKQSVDFFSYLEQADNGTLDFGDGATAPLTGNISGVATSTTAHTYSASGNYTAILTGSNSANGCGPYSDTMVVTVRLPQASFSLTPVVCKGEVQTFSASSTIDNVIGCARGYAWFVDTMPPHQTPYPNYTDFYYIGGTHTVVLWVKDINNCIDTATQTFIVDDPAPSFTFNTNPACLSSMPIQIINTTPQTPYAVSQFTWNLGAGSSPTLAASSVTVWPTYSYSATIPSQSYFVYLIAKSSLKGCTDTIGHTLVVSNPPDAYLYPYIPLPCVGVPVAFNATPDYTSTANFGDGTPTVSAVGSYTHIYTAPGNFTASLNVGDAAGCISSFTIEMDVQEAPTSDFLYYQTPSITGVPPVIGGSVFCSPVSITFSATSASSFEMNYFWNLGTGSPIVDDSVVGTIFNTPGIKTVTLTTGTFPNGCKTTTTKTLSVLGPTATPVLSKNSICQGDNIKLSIKDSSEVMGWAWFFNNAPSSGSLLASSAPSPTFSFNYDYFPLTTYGAEVITLYYFSSGSLCPVASTLGLQVNRVDADFNRNGEVGVPDSVHCINIADLFTNTSKKNYSTFINGLNFSWDFGNGVTSSSMSPGYTYPNPGVYTVSLTVVDPISGCKDEATKNMTINPLPTAVISVADSVCMGSSFQLTSSTSSDVSQYAWMPATGVDNPGIALPSATASVSTTYSLLVTNIYGCKGTSNTQYVYVQPPAPVIHWDTTVIVGQISTLNSYVGPNYNYTWTPLTNLSCDHCSYPVSTSTTNITYSVTIEDKMGCFRTISTYSVFIDPQTSVDVPTAFTPNGDGVNDVIYVEGWGIKKLNYFRIFNRWGQLLFETTDIKTGWDGYFRGVPQNMETYVYQVSVDTYIAGKSLEKTSSFRLIR